MSKTLGFSLYYCLKRPEVMTAVQEEIDNITGLQRMISLPFLTSPLYIVGDRGSVTLDDRANLPFTEATLLEVEHFPPTRLQH